MKLVLILLFAIYSLVSTTIPAQALYDPASVPNNKMGVHILHPSELQAAAKLVNSSGGAWGYVTVPIQPTDRDLVKWQDFMHQSKELHLIPIIRITTIPTGGTWDSAQATDLVDFANFLNELDWPTENRYIILFNEVNQSREWGGTVDPKKYTQIVKNARTIFKERSEHFFLLGPALDDALPDSATSMSAKRYLAAMHTHDNAVWSYFDGYSFHSYPNPGFSQPPRPDTFPGITSYRYLFTHYKLADKPVFITETGWDQTKLSAEVLSTYWNTAWEIWNSDPRVVAVTPFVLSGGEAFPTLSLTLGDGSYNLSGVHLFNLPKRPGTPRPAATTNAKTPADVSHTNESQSSHYRSDSLLGIIENFFRVIFGLPVKGIVSLAGQQLVVEFAQTPAQWEKGLSGRAELSGIEGMLFLFPTAHVPVFWMKETHFPLDMIWIRDNKVIEITRNVPPATTQSNLPTYSPSLPVNAVLEVPSGFSETHNIKPGDSIIYELNN